MFLKTYASKNRYNSLEDAKINGLKDDNVGGITYSPKTKKYTHRKGTELFNGPAGHHSWLKLN